MVAAVIGVVGAVLIAMTGALWVSVTSRLDRLSTRQEAIQDSVNRTLATHGERLSTLEGAVWPSEVKWRRRFSDSHEDEGGT